MSPIPPTPRSSDQRTDNDTSAPNTVANNSATAGICEPSAPRRRYAGLSQAQRRQQQQQQLIAAGIELFGRHGFRHTTVRGLCREAKLTDRYFYREFGSLERLLRAVYSDCMDRLYQQVYASVQPAAATTDATLLFRRTLQQFFQYMRDERIARICMIELEGVSDSMDQHYHSYIRSFAKLVLHTAQRLSAHQQPPTEHDLYLAMGLVGAIRQMTTHWLQSGYNTPVETLVDSALLLFHSALRRQS
ncbi:hypothetical protein CHH28_01475 [Bacterioplanes sanyensis]|uniref:HTH tetR-type domain-containing protein n=2 Tax=Bacterioplanes sanyensis TaxID=1249553 RepID=A0A222FF98_9GAMM|nr:hypothetical protein CHH28_01475 [Bacterioplanes sanyensis]